MINRRNFLKSLLAAGALAAISSIITEAADGRLEYRMKPGEVLDGLNCPEWGRVIAVKDCKILNCNFRGTSIVLEDPSVSMRNCSFDVTGLPEGLSAISVPPGTHIQEGDIYIGGGSDRARRVPGRGA